MRHDSHANIYKASAAQNTTAEMEPSHINSARWPTFSTAECGQTSVKAAVVPGPFCFTSGEIFIIPRRQHSDTRSPLIYSDPSRRRPAPFQSGKIKRENAPDNRLDPCHPFHSSFSLLVQFPTKSPAGSQVVGWIIHS